MMAIFTCKVCETRAVKKFSKDAYENGVVVVRCPGCKNDHLLADRLGVFGDDFDIKKVLGELGDSVVDDNLAANLTQEQLRQLVHGTKPTTA